MYHFVLPSKQKAWERDSDKGVFLYSVTPDIMFLVLLLRFNPKIFLFFLTKTSGITKHTTKITWSFCELDHTDKSQNAVLKLQSNLRKK